MKKNKLFDERFGKPDKEFKGYLPVILAKENTIDLSLEENKGWLELFRIAAQAPTSKCHGYSVDFSDGALRCLYCGEPCEINEHETKTEK